jgi:O-acetyl-ADP-ribose deacetylase (regulator of RNase III)
MIEYKKMDLCDVDRGIIAHGVNCQSKMGSGVAAVLKGKWPKIYPSYLAKCSTEDDNVNLLGQVDIVEISLELFIVNCFTQVNYGKDGKIYANPLAITKSFDKLFNFSNSKQLPIYIPKIGCGLGGLSWDKDVKNILEKCDTTFNNVHVFVCEL